MNKNRKIKQDKFWIGGKHTVIHALNNKKNTVYQIVLSSKKNLNLIPRHHLKLVKIRNSREIDTLFKTEINHQGFAVEINSTKTLTIQNLESNLETYKNVILLNKIFDDRNIGSIIRSCSAFDINCLIMEKDNFRPDSQLMYKTASGGMEHVNIYIVSNLNNAIKILKKNNFWIYSLDGAGKKNIYDLDFNTKSAFIFGSEGDGIQSLIKKNSDEIVFIPINKKIESLNLSNSVSIVLSLTKKSPLN